MTDHDRTACKNPECKASIANHAWGRIKAEGWFFQMNKDAWCPDHIPAWVKSWREHKKAVQNGGTPKVA